MTRDIKRRTQEDWAKFPQHVKYTNRDLEIGRVTNDILWFRISAWIRHIQNLFLIECLLQKSGYANGQGLLDIARENLSMVLVIYRHRDRFLEQHFGAEWIVSFRSHI